MCTMLQVSGGVSFIVVVVLVFAMTGKDLQGHRTPNSLLQDPYTVVIDWVF